MPPRVLPSDVTAAAVELLGCVFTAVQLPGLTYISLKRVSPYFVFLIGLGSFFPAVIKKHNSYLLACHLSKIPSAVYLTQ